MAQTKKGSPPGKLDGTDWSKIGKGALLAAAAAAITAAANYVGGLDLDDKSATIVSIVAVVLNIARKWILTGTG